MIFADHLPQNFWAFWLPASFGFSGAVEIFIFCSGIAAAQVFANAYANEGWLKGTARVLHRIWQVYWAYIAVFLVTATIFAAASNNLGLDLLHANARSLASFFADPASNLLGLLTLTYVPDYVAILPMYIGVLALLPFALAAAQYSQPAVGVFIAILWLIAACDLPKLPAQSWPQASWLFNPLGWQLVFFTGFALQRGWLKPPPADRHLIALAATVAVVFIPLAHPSLLNSFAVLQQDNRTLGSLIDPTNFGILRYIHFLALTYLAYVAAGPQGVNLQGGASALWGKTVALVCLVGQQAFAGLLASLAIAQALGVGLDLTGRGFLSVTVANLSGFALLVATAQCAAYFNSQPWRKKETGNV